MVRQTVTPQVFGFTEAAPVFVAAHVDGWQFQNSGKEIVYIKNGAASPITVTIPTPGVVDGLPLPDKTITIAAGQERAFSLRNVGTYKQADGWTQINFSSPTTVTGTIMIGGGNA